MIWIKRIAPFLIIAVFYFGYNYHQTQEIAKKESDQKRFALVTAQAWVGTMKYRQDPDAYIAYRDSLLAEYNLSKDSLKSFVESYESSSEALGLMSLYIKSYVDSLLIIEDSLHKLADTVEVVDTVLVKDTTL